MRIVVALVCGFLCSCQKPTVDVSIARAAPHRADAVFSAQPGVTVTALGDGAITNAIAVAIDLADAKNKKSIDSALLHVDVAAASGTYPLTARHLVSSTLITANDLGAWPMTDALPLEKAAKDDTLTIDLTAAARAHAGDVLVVVLSGSTEDFATTMTADSHVTLGTEANGITLTGFDFSIGTTDCPTGCVGTPVSCSAFDTQQACDDHASIACSWSLNGGCSGTHASCEAQTAFGSACSNTNSGAQPSVSNHGCYATNEYCAQTADTCASYGGSKTTCESNKCVYTGASCANQGTACGSKTDAASCGNAHCVWTVTGGACTGAECPGAGAACDGSNPTCATHTSCSGSVSCSSYTYDSCPAVAQCGQKVSGTVTCSAYAEAACPTSAGCADSCSGTINCSAYDADKCPGSGACAACQGTYCPGKIDCTKIATFDECKKAGCDATGEECGQTVTASSSGQAASACRNAGCTTGSVTLVSATCTGAKPECANYVNNPTACKDLGCTYTGQYTCDGKLDSCKGSPTCASQGCPPAYCTQKDCNTDYKATGVCDASCTQCSGTPACKNFNGCLAAYSGCSGACVNTPACTASSRTLIGCSATCGQVSTGCPTSGNGSCSGSYTGCSTTNSCDGNGCDSVGAQGSCTGACTWVPAGTCSAFDCNATCNATYCTQTQAASCTPKTCAGLGSAACQQTPYCLDVAASCHTLPSGPLDCSTLGQTDCNNESGLGCSWVTNPTCTGGKFACSQIKEESDCTDAKYPGCGWAPACPGNVAPVLSDLVAITDTALKTSVTYADADGHAPRTGGPSCVLRRGGATIGEAVVSRADGAEDDFKAGVVFAATFPLPPSGDAEVCCDANDSPGLAAPQICTPFTVTATAGEGTTGGGATTPQNQDPAQPDQEQKSGLTDVGATGFRGGGCASRATPVPFGAAFLALLVLAVRRRK